MQEPSIEPVVENVEETVLENVEETVLENVLEKEISDTSPLQNVSNTDKQLIETSNASDDSLKEFTVAQTTSDPTVKTDLEANQINSPTQTESSSFLNLFRTWEAKKEGSILEKRKAFDQKCNDLIKVPKGFFFRRGVLTKKEKTEESALLAEDNDIVVDDLPTDVSIVPNRILDFCPISNKMSIFDLGSRILIEEPVSMPTDISNKNVSFVRQSSTGQNFLFDLSNKLALNAGQGFTNQFREEGDGVLIRAVIFANYANNIYTSIPTTLPGRSPTPGKSFGAKGNQHKAVTPTVHPQSNEHVSRNTRLRSVNATLAGNPGASNRGSQIKQPLSYLSNSLVSPLASSKKFDINTGRVRFFYQNKRFSTDLVTEAYKNHDGSRNTLIKEHLSKTESIFKTFFDNCSDQDGNQLCNNISDRKKSAKNTAGFSGHTVFEDDMSVDTTPNEASSSSQNISKEEKEQTYPEAKFLRHYDVMEGPQKEIMDRNHAEAINFTKNNISAFNKMLSTPGKKGFFQSLYTLAIKSFKVFHYPNGGSLEQLQAQLESGKKIEIEEKEVKGPQGHLLTIPLPFKLSKELINKFRLDYKPKSQKKESSTIETDTTTSATEASDVSNRDTKELFSSKFSDISSIDTSDDDVSEKASQDLSATAPGTNKPELEKDQSKADKMLSSFKSMCQEFLENKTGEELAKAKIIVHQVKRLVGILMACNALDVDHFDLETARSIFFSRSTNHVRWINNDSELTVIVPKLSNLVRSYKGNVLVPFRERYAGMCGVRFGLMHGFLHSICDDTSQAFFEFYLKPYKYSGLCGDEELHQKCLEIAEQLEIDVEEIDLTDGELNDFIVNMVKGYIYEIDRVEKTYFKNLKIASNLQWAFYQTIKRFELLAGLIEKSEIFEYKHKTIIQQFTTVVQQKNTLIEAIKVSTPEIDLSKNPAILEIKEKFTKCILKTLSLALNQDTNPLNTFTTRFKTPKELATWYTELQTNEALLPVADALAKL